METLLGVFTKRNEKLYLTKIRMVQWLKKKKKNVKYICIFFWKETKEIRHREEKKKDDEIRN